MICCGVCGRTNRNDARFCCYCQTDLRVAFIQQPVQTASPLCGCGCGKPVMLGKGMCSDCLIESKI